MSDFVEEDLNDQSEPADRKQQFRDRYKGATLQSMIRHMADIKAVREELEERLKNVNAHYDVLRIELIPAKMDEEGVQRIVIEGIGRVSLTADLYVSTIDKPGLFNWLRKHKLGSLITEQVAPSTLKAFVKNRIVKGEEVPENLVKTTPFTRASITKA